MDKNVIQVKNVEKIFKAPHEKHTSLKAKAVNIFSNKRYTKYSALKNINLEIKKGEFFGIVGKNGSGKSTLLKVLANIYYPTKGSVIVNGTIAPFIELGVGFNPELSGRENVFLSGTILGMSKKKIESLYDEIVDFAELREFMDQKLKNYSSGMQVRLAFSIAVRAEADILLIDEVLAVGDAAFQKKCFDYFRKLKEGPTTVCFVTHDMSSVMQFCDRALFIDKGKVVKIGKPDKISELYLLENYQSKQKNLKSKFVKSVDIFQDNKKTDYLLPNKEAKVVINTKKIKGKKYHIGFQIFNEKNVYCFGTNTKSNGYGLVDLANGMINCSFIPRLTKNNYYINIAILTENGGVEEYNQQIASFRIRSDSSTDGVASLNTKWFS